MDRSAQSAPQPVFRPSDTRPKHDAARLERFGIRKYESKRLLLYTDIEPEIANTLPAYVDALYDALTEYFGPLPPNRERTEYQMTGYIMRDKELFRQAGLLPTDMPKFDHGRHRGAEFWMFDQEHEFYRRHLMLHEATHCVTMMMPDTHALTWYLEGMAELFGTHRIDESGKIHFGVMPADPNEFVGWGRIEMIRREIAAGRFRSLDDINSWFPEDFLATPPYAWSWALCEFLNTHPRYRERFRKLTRSMTGDRFLPAVRDAFAPDLPQLRTEWPLYAHSLEMGFDIERSVIDFRAGAPLSADRPQRTFAVAVDRGWQSSEIRLDAGTEYELVATGRFTLAKQPKPWESEPQGISFLYSEGRPLGMLLAAIHTRTDPNDMSPETMLDVMPVGAQLRFTAAATGTLYFRVNDFWSKLRDNEGRVEVRVTKLQPKADQATTPK
ncbi:MAG: hypothetical protein WD648_07385 [Planctomycetaceae bacterium]